MCTCGFFYLSKTQGITYLRLTALALCFILSMLQTGHYTNKMVDLYSDEFSIKTAMLVMAGFYWFFVVLVSANRSITIPGAVTLGAMGYPIYLLHENIGYIVLNAFTTDSNRYWVLGIFTVAASKSLIRLMKVFRGFTLSWNWCLYNHCNQHSTGETDGD